jgi:Domain of unknown function (DUF4148)
MNAKTFVTAAIAILSAASAFAQSSPENYTLPQPYTSTVTRAQVRAELLAARQAPHHLEGDQYVVNEVFVSTVTPAQVHAEALEAIRVGAFSRREQNIIPTAAQLESIRMAGERALKTTLASR